MKNMKVLFDIVILFSLLSISLYADNKFKNCTFKFISSDAEYGWNMSFNIMSLHNMSAEKYINNNLCNISKGSTFIIGDIGEKRNRLIPVKVKVNGCTFNFKYGLAKNDAAYTRDNYNSKCKKNKKNSVNSIEKHAIGNTYTVLCKNDTYGIVDIDNEIICASGNNISPKCKTWTIGAASNYICK